MDYDYKPGEFLVIKSGESPDKTFCIVSGKDKAGEFGVYLMDAKTKAVLGRLEEIETSWGTAPEGYGGTGRPIRSTSELHPRAIGVGRSTSSTESKISGRT